MTSLDLISAPLGHLPTSSSKLVVLSLLIIPLRPATAPRFSKRLQPAKIFLSFLRCFLPADTPCVGDNDLVLYDVPAMGALEHAPMLLREPSLGKREFCGVDSEASSANSRVAQTRPPSKSADRRPRRV